MEPDQSVEELLRDVRDGAREGAGQSRLSDAGPLSALLVRLDRNAEKTAKTMRRLTWAIVALAIVMLALAGVLAWLTFVLIEEEYSPDDSDEPASRTTALYFQAQPQFVKFDFQGTNTP
jgi:hypothetical protein